MTIFLLAQCVALLLCPVSLSDPIAAQLEQMSNVIIHEADMKDIDFHAIAKHHPLEELTKRHSPGHIRLCPVQEIRLKAKDFFKGRFSENAVIVPPTFQTVSCLNSTVSPHLSRGQHCLNIMDCQETRTSKFFIVFDPAKRRKTGCTRGQIAKINNVPAECSCLWPRYLGSDPDAFLHRQH